MPANAITSLTNENQPRSRENAAREILGSLDVLELVRYGTTQYAEQLVEDFTRVPHGTKSIEHELASIATLPQLVAKIGTLPKRGDYGGFSRRNEVFGSITLGDKPVFGEHGVPNLRLKTTYLHYNEYKGTRRSTQPEAALSDTMVKRRIEITSGIAELGPNRKEYTRNQAGLQFDLDSGNRVIAMRGVMLNGETPHIAEDLPYYDNIDLSEIVDALDTIAS